jgi:hypothetical protein
MHSDFLCCVLFVVLANKNEDVTVTKTNVFIIIRPDDGLLGRHML